MPRQVGAEVAIRCGEVGRVGLQQIDVRQSAAIEKLDERDIELLSILDDSSVRTVVYDNTSCTSQFSASVTA